MDKKKIFKWCVDGAIVLLLLACLWVPEAPKALGRVFVWDQFHSWDALLILPGWAYVHGQGLNTDIISSWGLGAVIFISRGAEVLGGFDYTRVLNVLMAMAIVYYALLYVFLRVWLRHVLLAVLVIALAVKVQFFNSGISPLIWIFPQDTPARHWLDLPVLWCLWQHARRFSPKYLLGAAAGTGLGLAWVFSSGFCLLLAFWGYLIFLLMRPKYRQQLARDFKGFRRIIFYGLLPLPVMLLALFLMQGHAVFHPVFWANTFEPMRSFLQGVGTVPIYRCLYDRHFFAYIAGFVIPVIYIWTLIIITGLSDAEKLPQEDLFLVPLCVYGLSLYAHYLAHSTTNHYYAVGIPVVMVIGFWLRVSVKSLRILLVLALGSWAALFTNVLFIYYPNVFDISRMDWKPETGFYQSQMRFDRDAAMIAGLVKPEEGAALVSSFEAPLLIQAKRRPFFYYAPLVISERLDKNSFAGTNVDSQVRLDKTLAQITDQKPEYIFIEKRLLGQWPPELAQNYPGIILVLRFVIEHYQPVDQGVYLIAMRKKRDGHE